jgi:hypothetical protein
MEITAVFIADEDNDGKILFATLAAVFLGFALLFLFMLLLRNRPKVTGTVRFNGTGVAGAKIGYTNGNKSGYVKTDENGEYVIYVAMKTDFAITSLTKDGVVISDDPSVEFLIEKKVTELDIAAKTE